MSQIDEEKIMSETEAEHSDGVIHRTTDNDSLKFVPVAESIRYRKRAQAAEKKNEILAEQLTEAKSQSEKMAEKLSDIGVEQKLMRKLAAAGTVDLETAVLIAKARMKDSDKVDMDGLIVQLKKEKRYLFADSSNRTAPVKKTAAAKDRMANNQTILERAAKKAATTGNRTDLQEYLKLRRNFV